MARSGRDALLNQQHVDHLRHRQRHLDPLAGGDGGELDAAGGADFCAGFDVPHGHFQAVDGFGAPVEQRDGRAFIGIEAEGFHAGQAGGDRADDAQRVGERGDHLRDPRRGQSLPLFHRLPVATAIACS